jgi:hypothetical protein
LHSAISNAATTEPPEITVTDCGQTGFRAVSDQSAGYSFECSTFTHVTRRTNAPRPWRSVRRRRDKRQSRGRALRRYLKPDRGQSTTLGTKPAVSADTKSVLRCLETRHSLSTHKRVRDPFSDKLSWRAIFLRIPWLAITGTSDRTGRSGLLGAENDRAEITQTAPDPSPIGCYHSAGRHGDARGWRSGLRRAVGSMPSSQTNASQRRVHFHCHRM